MCDPGPAVVGKRKEICLGDRTGIEDVLACFEVPPEIAVTQRSGCKKEGQGKNVHLEDVAKGLVQAFCAFGGLRFLRYSLRRLTKEITNEASNSLHRSGYTSFGGYQDYNQNYQSNK